MYEDSAEASQEEEGEIPADAPPAKKKKLMVAAVPKKSAPKPSAPKKHVACKRTTKDIPATEKNKDSPSREFATGEEGEAPLLKKLRSHMPLHNDAHPIAEDMKKRTDQGLRLWNSADPYAIR
ncbi:hypothetical protein ZWY2020_039819 [Hordeum vulgare]|nr:hypothetical protein ZWY2020_039819 [Hordeum vulgare]